MMKGQVWIETVVYTLIGLAIIGIVLTLITPRINEYKDKGIIEQTISSLNAMDSKISETLGAPGNIRVVEFTMRRGEIYFDAENDAIYFEMNDSNYLFSEPGVETSLGKIRVVTQEGLKKHSVTLRIDYPQNISFDGQDQVRKFSPAATPYRFSFENLGVLNGNYTIDVKSLSG